MRHQEKTAILKLIAPDQKGIVLRIAEFLYNRGANIIHADQHRDDDKGLFFMRVEWDLKDFSLDLADFCESFTPLAKAFQMRWQLSASEAIRNIAIFVSKETHCLADLLYHVQSGSIYCNVAAIVSNHQQALPLASFYQVPFYYFPITAANQAKQEEQELELLATLDIQTIVLARYMRILSKKFVERYPENIINIHHSFLPAFSGSKPYQQAHERGVKLIGATSHYVTEILDDGPIIEQDVIRISHRDQVKDLQRKGKDLEKTVLARALRWHLEDRVLCYDNKTVIFD